MIGVVLSDRYEITEIIGHGGMATVYKGVDKKLGRTVAIKVIRSDTSAAPNFANDFIAEGQNIAALNHPNIVAVYDIGNDNGVQYLVLEFVPGKTLREILAKGPLRIGCALDYAGQIALGLAAAHERGIVHCDVKPQNVLITDSGVAKLADFGISRAGSSSNSFTGGVIVGTLDYLAPERIEGKEPDERSDIYALGLVTYEMLAGRLPFDTAPAQALAQRAASDPKPLAELMPGISTQIAAAVMRSLQRMPANRYESAQQFANALSSSSFALNDAPTVVTAMPRNSNETSRSRWKWRRRSVLASVVGLLALLALAFGAVNSTFDQPPAGGQAGQGRGPAYSDAAGGLNQSGNALVPTFPPSTATPTLTATPTYVVTPTSTFTATPTRTPVPAPKLKMPPGERRR